MPHKKCTRLFVPQIMLTDRETAKDWTFLFLIFWVAH